MNDQQTHEYDDIIDLPRPASDRPKMTMAQRAAQFGAFAALSGHDRAIDSTATDHADRVNHSSDGDLEPSL